jgi:hypothetical protein
MLVYLRLLMAEFIFPCLICLLKGRGCSRICQKRANDFQVIRDGILISPILAEYPVDDGPPSLEIIVPLARKLSGACEDQCGVQHLAILAFWYLLIGIYQRRKGHVISF